MVNRHVLILVVGMLSILSSSLSSSLIKPLSTAQRGINTERILAPDTLSKLSLTYPNMVSTILWMELLNYYGGTEQNQRNYSYISNRLEGIQKMNPYAEAPYYMAGLALPWETHNTKLPNTFLKKAMHIFPKDWRWPYYRGFNAYWFDHDMKTAAKYMALAARLPDAPPIVASLAARMHSESSDLNTALAFLTHLYNNKQDPALKKQLEYQIKAIQTEQILRRVDQLLAKTPAWQEGNRDLRSLGIRFPETLPDGGHIILNAEGVPVSSVSRKRFKVFVPPKRKKQTNELRSQ